MQALILVAHQMQWSHLEPFDNWFLLYCVLELKLILPHLTALAVCGQPSVEENGCIYLQRSKKRHCLWGPAVIDTLPTGQLRSIKWQKHGEYDRTDGPALEMFVSFIESFAGHYNGNLEGWEGSTFWMLGGKLHRADKPAINHLEGTQYWWEHGNLYRTRTAFGQEKYFELNPWPPIIEPNETILLNHHRLHRVGGPAFIKPDGTKHWYQHGKLHRDDGPAVEIPNGICQWWLNNRRVDEGDLPAKRQKLEVD
jgi:hypothetical protein